MTGINVADAVRSERFYGLSRLTGAHPLNNIRPWPILPEALRWS
jgi:hypothetical protein